MTLDTDQNTWLLTPSKMTCFLDYLISTPSNNMPLASQKDIMPPDYKKDWTDREVWARSTLMTFVSCVALRAGLISILTLVLITRPANRERTFVACNEEVTICCLSHVIPTDLTCLTAWRLQWLLHSSQETENTSKIFIAEKPIPKKQVFFCHYTSRMRKTGRKVMRNAFYL